MARNSTYLNFESEFNEILASDGKWPLPNIKLLDRHEALLRIAGADKMYKPYRFRVETFDPPKPSGQTHSIAYYPRIFTNAKGMGSRFDGTGVIVIAVGGEPEAFSFTFCEHEWDERGSDHNRGWHRKVCTKCGFDASIDSGD